jgi:Phage tail assembly chaperone proteins, E, or 41 or 14
MQEKTRQREGFISDDEPEKIETPVEEAPPPPPEEWPLVVKLRRPIENDKREMIGELSFKEPTANHLIRAGGTPFEIEYTEQNPDGSWRIRVHTDYRKLLTLMANLSGVMEPFLQKMDPRDLTYCGLRLQGFFLA